MKRKIVKQGSATLMISLPAKWAKEKGLDKGDEVALEEDGDNLIVKLDESDRKGVRASIDISGYTPLVNRVMMALYVKGVDELEVHFDDKGEIRDFQKRVINELLGFEIIKQSGNSMTIKDVTGSGMQDIDDIIRRIFFILDSMVEEFIEALEKKQDIKSIIEIDSSVNKFCNFCMRMLNKKGYSNQMTTSQMYGIVNLLEDVGDIYKRIAVEVDKKAKLDKDQISALRRTREQIALFKDLLFKYDKVKNVAFAKEYEVIKKKIKGENKVDFYLMQLNDHIVRMNNYLLVMSL